LNQWHNGDNNGHLKIYIERDMNGQQQDKVELAVNEAGLATVVGVVVGNVDPADVQESFNVENCLVETILTEAEEYDAAQNYTVSHQQINNANCTISASAVQPIVMSKPLLQHHQDNGIRMEVFHDVTHQPIEINHGITLKLGERKKSRVYKHPEGFPCDLCPYRAKMKSHLRAHRQSVHEGIKYPCDQCEYKATAMGSLRRHYNAIHSGLKYPCSECDHVSNTPANLKYHHNTVHMGLRFPCMHCDYKATTASHLKKHKESVHEGIKYKCNECDHESTTKESLKVHKRSLHKKILFPCLKCDYVAKVNSHLKQHVRSVHDKVRFPCDNCEYTAINNSRLKHHKETMHSGLKFTCDNHAVQITTAKQLRQLMREDVKFECVDCALVAKDTIQILKKQKGNKSDDEYDDDDSFEEWEIKKEKMVVSGKNRCEVCSHEARNPAELKQHILAIHEGVTHNCHLCEFRTTHPSSLKRHKQTVHPFFDLRSVCDLCIGRGQEDKLKQAEGKVEMANILENRAAITDCQTCKDLSKRSLELLRCREETDSTDQTNSNQQVQQWVCGECGHEGKSAAELRQHKLTIHQGITYPCDLCEYVASRPDALKRHKKGKHEEKKFPCSQCQFRAHSAVKLSQHKLQVHVGVRLLCNLCDFSATKLAKLKEHKMMVHDGKDFKEAGLQSKVSKFQCEECQFSTTQVELLQAHIDSAHKVCRFDCDACSFQSVSPEELKKHISEQHQAIPGLQSSSSSTLQSSGLSISSSVSSQAPLQVTPELRTHLDTMQQQQQQPNFACIKCDFKATGEEYLKLHIARHHTETKFPCGECSFVSSSEEGLIQHKSASHEGEGYPCDLSNHQERTRSTYYEEKVKHPYLHINGQEYDQATLSGLLPSPFRTALPGTNISVPTAYPTYTLHTPATTPLTYQGVPSTITMPSFPTLPGSLTAGSLAGAANPGSLARGSYPWPAGFNMNPTSF